jgi:uncharacterized protein (DUF2336 family)
MSVLQELNDAISKGTPESRLKALWHATDMLIMGRYTESEIWIFGEVIGRLSEEIELAARSQLAKRLARSDKAPVHIINKLAFDDSIDVAGPILRYSERLSNQALVANARSKSQQHLVAISRRRSIDEPVTDVLVTRGDQAVVNSVVVNAGARFSDSGFLHLIKRSENDSILAEHLGRRRDIPRHLFQQLIAKASEDVRKKLEVERPEAGNAVADVAGRLHAMFGPASNDYFTAKKTVGAQHQLGNLGEAQILEYAQARKLNEAIVALSLSCSLPVDVVERAMLGADKEALLILAKSLDLSWPTTMALLFLGASDYRIPAKDIDEMKAEFARLDVETSRRCWKPITRVRSRRLDVGSSSCTSCSLKCNWLDRKLAAAAERSNESARFLSAVASPNGGHAFAFALRATADKSLWPTPRSGISFSAN